MRFQPEMTYSIALKPAQQLLNESEARLSLMFAQSNGCTRPICFNFNSCNNVCSGHNEV